MDGGFLRYITKTLLNHYIFLNPESGSFQLVATFTVRLVFKNTSTCMQIQIKVLKWQ